ncbi:MAG: hypothetical protein AB8F65_02025 [Woeseiaceae bacterium]
MHHCHSHNLVDASKINDETPWGIRVTVPASDPINRLIGNDWQRDHWFRTELDRDEAFDAMNKRHGFYRIGDDPSQILTKIQAD